MSSIDRRPYLSAAILDQALLDACHDNAEIRLEMIVDIETPDGMIHASDRNKYVGSTFYEALCQFPVINRTMGEWLSNELQFSTLTLELSNVDGRFNKYLPGGADYGGWIGKSVQVKLGLAEAAGTYQTIFKGKITDIGGFKRSVKSITIIARDDYDTLSVNFPPLTLSAEEYEDAEETVSGTTIPVILGDWTVSLDPDPAVVPGIVANGADPDVYGGVRNDLLVVVAANDLASLDSIRLKRGDEYFLVPSGERTIGTGNKSFQLNQNGTTWVGGVAYLFEPGDEFFVTCVGPTLGGYGDNIVAQARWLLEEYGDLSAGDFDSSWVTYRDKATPAQSNIAGIKSRVWIDDPQPLINYVLSMLEQVRLEAFINQDQKIEIASLHFEDFDDRLGLDPHVIRNWDVIRGTFEPQLDERNNFNRAQGVFDFRPDRGENARTTLIMKNTAAIHQMGKEISKKIVFPNLYDQDQVEDQLQEILRLSSASYEHILTGLTWRSLLQELSGFVKVRVDIGSSVFDDVPAMIREIGYDPEGLKLTARLWSMQMVPFPGYNDVTPLPGTVGGFNATISKE
jgi:hypothetical protein